jgi:hypothetical protein
MKTRISMSIAPPIHISSPFRVIAPQFHSHTTVVSSASADGQALEKSEARGEESHLTFQARRILSRSSPKSAQHGVPTACCKMRAAGRTGAVPSHRRVSPGDQRVVAGGAPPSRRLGSVFGGCERIDAPVAVVQRSAARCDSGLPAGVQHATESVPHGIRTASSAGGGPVRTAGGSGA